MPNAIELLAIEGSSLVLTLERALEALRENGIVHLAAGQVLSPDDPPFARILFRDSKDRERAIRLLTASDFNLRFE